MCIRDSGKTYCAEQKVVVPICLANNNCPMSLGEHKIEDGNVISYHTEAVSYTHLDGG